MAFKHGVSEEVIKNGINFNATAEIPLPKMASILMPQTKNGSDSEPKIKNFEKSA